MDPTPAPRDAGIAPPRPPALTAAAVRALIDRVPRVRLAHLPTPLDELPRLTAAMGGATCPPLFVKRDDCTGLALGGNKSRHLEFTLADALRQGADCVIQSAAPQSNDARQLSAAAARLGLKTYLLPRSTLKVELQGNLLLDHLMGAEIRFIDPQVDREAEKRRLAEELRAKGRRPYVMGAPAVPECTAIAYTLCAVELHEQCQALGVDPAWVYVCSGSGVPHMGHGGGTQAGLMLGGKALGRRWKVVGLPATRIGGDNRPSIAEIGNGAAQRLGLDARLEPGEVINTDAYVGEGYGLITDACREAIYLVARTEGLLLDPVYTGKVMAGLIDHIRAGRVGRDEPVIFVHTGGLPALFAYRDELVGAPA
ncbi:MAG: D-cysteine desulfhydrase family protein [Armatimonadetes bacterium]|nr:D-cysteine desulfhydrase family protein [Armatimonadota bacterium]